jgi:condensin complex subunit 3
LLGKLHISGASTEEKLRDLYSEVEIAIEDKLITDATGRNALFKIHVSLGKIVNTLGGRKSVAPESRMSITPSEATERTSLDGEEDSKIEASDVGTIKEEDAEDEPTLLADLTVRTKPNDDLVSQLLSDDDEIL